jgi:hypothetical protein
MVNRRLWLSPVILSVLGLACPTKEAPDDPVTVDGGGENDARDVAPKLPPPQHRDLGAACSATGDCASGLCVDGVCCDAACDAECFACNVSGAAGRCTALDGAEDLLAVPPCAGTRVCARDSSGVTACRLKDGEACLQSSDCASDSCRSYYRDQDGDGYGVDAADTIRRCDAAPLPPQGFSTMAGDCCDADPGAKPSVASYFTTRDACGTFDWNCSGVEERQSSGSCPTTSGAALSCGQACTVVFKGTASVLFVQGCR